MIFSNAAVSRYVREHFVAAWENVRSVPVAEIDFGDGRRVQRTLNGNVATYICAPDGRIVDILPGLYPAETYLERLREALGLYRRSLASSEDEVIAHHRRMAFSSGLAALPREDVGKYAVEGPLREAVRARAPKRADFGKEIVEQPARKSIEDAALEADAQHNLRERMPIVHTILSERPYRPSQVTKRLYREVLHVDLDDPHLGLLTNAFDGGAYGRR